MKSPTPALENRAEEQVVLGKILQSPTAYQQVAEVLRPEHFAIAIHGRIYEAYRSIVNEGKSPSLRLLQARVGDEYGDGMSTMALMTALLRDAESGDLEGVEVLIDLWKRRQYLEELARARKEAEDPNAHIDDLMADHEVRFQDIGRTSQAAPIRSIGEVVKSAMQKSATTRSSGVVPGDDTGLPSLDEILGRIHPGDLGFIGADPGAGKTILAQQIAHHIAGNRGRSVAFFQLEMTAEDMGRRYLSSQAAMSTAEVEEGAYNFDQAEWLATAVERVQDQPFFLDDRPDLTWEQIRDRIISLKRSAQGLNVVIVDHLLKVGTAGAFKDYFAQVKYVTGQAKKLAKQQQIAIIFLVHRTLGAQREGGIPRIADFDGGSSIQRDADWVIGIVRPDVYHERHEPDDRDSPKWRAWVERMKQLRGTIDAYMLKGRRADRGAKRSFDFDGRLSTVREKKDK